MNYNHLGPILTRCRNEYIERVSRNPPEKNILNAITYNSSFLETDNDTIRCTYDVRLECDNTTFNTEIERFMKLDEIKKTKTIYFHDRSCHNKAIVNNKNAKDGEACVNLSYL